MSFGLAQAPIERLGRLLSTNSRLKPLKQKTHWSFSNHWNRFKGTSNSQPQFSVSIYFFSSAIEIPHATSSAPHISRNP